MPARIIKAAFHKVTPSHPLAFSCYQAPNNPSLALFLSFSLPSISSRNPSILSEMTQPPLLNATSAEILIQRPRHEWKLCGDSWLDCASWKLLFCGIIREYSANPIFAQLKMRDLLSYIFRIHSSSDTLGRSWAHASEETFFLKERIVLQSSRMYRIINRDNNFR